MSPVQGDEHEHAEPHTVTDGLHAGSHPPKNPAFSFHPSAQQRDIAGGSSAPPVSPEMWFLQETRAPQNRVHEAVI